MASNACRALTGYPALLLAYLWNTYSNAFPEGPRGAPSWKGDRWGKKYTKQLVYFYLFFVYIHMYPTNAQMSHTLRVAGQDNGISHTTFYTLVMPIGHALANAVAEINYDDRLDPMNHHPFFPVGVTQIFDTFPIYVATPSDWRVARLLFQPKYKACVLKVQIGISLTRVITYFSGLHLGTASDSTIFEDTWDTHNMFDWEYALGDKIYGACRHVLMSHRKPRGGTLNAAQEADNEMVDFVRARVEQVIAQVVQHNLFATRPGYRGTLAHLSIFVAVTMHATAALIAKIEPSRMLPGFGPWPHSY